MSFIILIHLIITKLIIWINKSILIFYGDIYDIIEFEERYNILIFHNGQLLTKCFNKRLNGL